MTLLSAGLRCFQTLTLFSVIAVPQMGNARDREFEGNFRHEANRLGWAGTSGSYRTWYQFDEVPLQLTDTYEIELEFRSDTKPVVHAESVFPEGLWLPFAEPALRPQGTKGNSLIHLAMGGRWIRLDKSKSEGETEIFESQNRRWTALQNKKTGEALLSAPGGWTMVFKDTKIVKATLREEGESKFFTWNYRDDGKIQSVTRHDGVPVLNLVYGEESGYPERLEYPPGQVVEITYGPQPTVKKLKDGKFKVGQETHITRIEQNTLPTPFRGRFVRSVTAEGNLMLAISEAEKPPLRTLYVVWDPETKHIVEDNQGRYELITLDPHNEVKMLRHRLDGTVEGYRWDPVEKTETYLRPDRTGFRRRYEKTLGADYMKYRGIERFTGVDGSLITD